MAEWMEGDIVLYYSVSSSFRKGKVRNNKQTKSFNGGLLFLHEPNAHTKQACNEGSSSFIYTRFKQ